VPFRTGGCVSFRDNGAASALRTELRTC
jgi:hypothetical protein